MKIDVTSIIIAHWRTLRNYDEERTSKIDLITFVVTPLTVGTLFLSFSIELADEVFTTSISVFAIFSALLFSVQVAMYGVFRADRNAEKDAVLASEARFIAEETRKLLREVNANVSYLILLSCVAVTVFLIFFAAPIPRNIESCILSTLYVHFLFNLLMVLKRAHEIFDAEYARRRASN